MSVRSIQELLSATGNTPFALNIFDSASIAAIEAALTEKNGKPYLKCRVRGKDLLAKPEEVHHGFLWSWGSKPGVGPLSQLAVG